MEYIPIDCNYYDELEAFATKKEIVNISFKDKDNADQNIKSRIKDFFIKEKVEYMLLENGDSLRLDKIIAVNDKERPMNGSCNI